MAADRSARSGTNARLDVVILHKGQHNNVEIGTGLRGTGWNGGQFVVYSAGTAPIGNTGQQLGIVEAAPGSGSVAGFLVFSSSDAANDEPEFYTSYRPEETGVAAMSKDDGKYKFFVFETDNAAERATEGAGAVLVYALNDRLYVSDRGRLTSENEFGGDGVVVGICFHVPVVEATTPELNYVGLDYSNSL